MNPSDRFGGFDEDYLQALTVTCPFCNHRTWVGEMNEGCEHLAVATGDTCSEQWEQVPWLHPLHELWVIDNDDGFPERELLALEPEDGALADDWRRLAAWGARFWMDDPELQPVEREVDECVSTCSYTSWYARDPTYRHRLHARAQALLDRVRRHRDPH